MKHAGQLCFITLINQLGWGQSIKTYLKITSLWLNDCDKRLLIIRKPIITIIELTLWNLEAVAQIKVNAATAVNSSRLKSQKVALGLQHSSSKIRVGGRCQSQLWSPRRSGSGFSGARKLFVFCFPPLCKRWPDKPLSSLRILNQFVKFRTC